MAEMTTESGTAKRPVVLQLVPALETGGAERTAVDIAARLVAEGWGAVVASAGGRMVAEVEAAGARHVTLPLDRKSPLALWRNARAIERLADDRRFYSVSAARSLRRAEERWDKRAIFESLETKLAAMSTSQQVRGKR